MYRSKRRQNALENYKIKLSNRALNSNSIMLVEKKNGSNNEDITNIMNNYFLHVLSNFTVKNSETFKELMQSTWFKLKYFVFHIYLGRN